MIVQNKMLKPFQIIVGATLCFLVAACGGKKEAEIDVLSSEDITVTGNTPKLIAVPKGKYNISCVSSSDEDKGLIQMKILLQANKSEMKNPQMTSPVKVALMGEEGKKLDLSLTMDLEERQRFEKWISECAQGAVEEFKFNSTTADVDFWEDILGDVRSIRLEEVNASEVAEGAATTEETPKPQKEVIPVYFSLSGVIGDAYDASMQMNGRSGSVSFTADGRYQYMQLRLVSNDSAGNLVVQSYYNGKRIATYRGRYTGGSYSGTARIWNGVKVSFNLY